jgi:hypothetical protein
LLKLGLSDFHISAAPEEPSVQAQPAVNTVQKIHRRRVHWAVPATAVVALLLIIAGLTLFLRRPLPPPVRIVRFDLIPPKDAVDFVVSPDGLHLVFSASDDQGITSLWMHSFDVFGERRLPGTEGGASPFWSPDSHSVGFFAARKLKTIDISNVATQILCDARGQEAPGMLQALCVAAVCLDRCMVVRAVATTAVIPEHFGLSDDPPAALCRMASLPLCRGLCQSKNGGIFAGCSTRRKYAGLLPVPTNLCGQCGALRPDGGYGAAFILLVWNLPGRRRIRFADHVRRFSVSENGVLAYQSGEHLNPPRLHRSVGKPVQTINDAGACSFLSRMARFSPSDGDIWLSDLSAA